MFKDFYSLNFSRNEFTVYLTFTVYFMGDQAVKILFIWKKFHILRMLEKSNSGSDFETFKF